MEGDRLTLPGLITRWAALQPDKPFMITAERVMTYGDLDRESRSTAAWLIANGVAKGSRVGLIMPNGTDWAAAAAGISRAGGVIVALSTLLRPPELQAQLQVGGVEHLIVVADFRGRNYVSDLEEISPGLVPGRERLFDDVLPRLRSVAVWEGALGLAERERAPGDLADAMGTSVRPADDLAVMFTSGSSGTPKGVIHTHGGAIAATWAGLETRCLRRDDLLYIPMPFFWVGGFGTGLISVLVSGATLISEAQSEPAGTLDLLEKARVTLFRGWPDQAAALAAHETFARANLQSLREGSLEAILPESAHRPPGFRAPLLGMSESFGPYCGYRLDRDLPPTSRGSCGRPFEGVEVRIVDPDDGAPALVGRTGEIQLRGPNLMRGICGRLRSGLFTPDGFYPTRDLGHLDGEGFLYFDGRLDDMFKVKGATVYPSEVEEALQALPSVARAYVFDVPDERGASVAAVVVSLNPGSITASEVEQQVRMRLSSFKVPTRWKIIEGSEVPFTSSGKVDKSGLKALFAP